MIQDKSVEAIGPDCLNCWKKNICPQMEEGKFCGQWQSAEPSPHPSPSATPSEGCRPASAENQPKGGFSGRSGSPQGEGWNPNDAWSRGEEVGGWI